MAGIASEVVEPVTAALLRMGYRPGRRRGARAELEDALLDGAAAALRDDCLGLSLARQLPIGSLGTLDYALCVSRSLRQGLERLARHYGVATRRVRMRLRTAGGEALLELERAPGVHHSRHWIEMSFGVIAERIRQTVGRPVTFAVELRHGPPAAVRTHAEFFGAPVRFARPADRLAFPAALLERPLRTASASLARYLDRQLQALDLAPARARALVERVRGSVEASFGRGNPALARTARELAVAPRTLQRDLRRGGTSFAALLDEARRDRALRLLKEGGAIAEISDRLGFSEPSAFFRAFRRWTGQSPRGWARP
ncbi:MAG: AraC family transcriptional regulator [Myxococcales bacterium]